MSISTEIARITQAKADIKTAIEAKGVTVPSSAKIDVYDDYVAQISGGGPSGPDPEKSVRFFDYDGTLLYSYTRSEFLALSAMPANPSHTGLTAQGWNWTLQQAQDFVRDYEYCEIGQLYITSDRKTRLHIRILSSSQLTVPIYWNQTDANGVEIDWGDGSATTKVNATGAQNTSHTYASTGNYVISFTSLVGTYYLGSAAAMTSGSGSSGVFGQTGDQGNIYSSILTQVNLGENITIIGDRGLIACQNLETVTVTDAFEKIGYCGILGCTNLKAFVFPPSFNQIGAYGCYTWNNCKAICFGFREMSSSGKITTGVNAIIGVSASRIVISSTNISSAGTIEAWFRIYDIVVLPYTSVTSGTINTTTFRAKHICTDANTTGDGKYSTYVVGTSRTIADDAVYKVQFSKNATSVKVSNTRYLNSLTCWATTPPTLSLTSGIVIEHIYVPAESVQTYKGATGWIAFADIIEAATL